MENPWNGIVRNKSDKWVICLWDTSTITGGDKKWHGKALAPGRRSPNWLDVDGVTALERTVAISGWRRSSNCKRNGGGSTAAPKRTSRPTAQL